MFCVDSKSRVGRGKLTERLLAQGLITPNMLQELKKEWTENKSDFNANDDDDDDLPKKPRRKRRTK